MLVARMSVVSPLVESPQNGKALRSARLAARARLVLAVRPGAAHARRHGSKKYRAVPESAAQVISAYGTWAGEGYRAGGLDLASAGANKDGGFV